MYLSALTTTSKSNEGTRVSCCSAASTSHPPNTTKSQSDVSFAVLFAREPISQISTFRASKRVRTDAISCGTISVIATPDGGWPEVNAGSIVQRDHVQRALPHGS